MLSRNQIRQAALQYLYAASQTPETEREGIWDILMEPFRGDYCKLKAKAVSGHLTRDYPDKLRLFITRARETADKLQQDPLTLPVRDQLQDLLAKEGEFNASLLRLKKALHEDPSNDRGSLSAACDAAQGLNTALMQMRRRLLDTLKDFPAYNAIWPSLISSCSKLQEINDRINCLIHPDDRPSLAEIKKWWRQGGMRRNSTGKPKPWEKTSCAAGTGWTPPSTPPWKTTPLNVSAPLTAPFCAWGPMNSSIAKTSQPPSSSRRPSACRNASPLRNPPASSTASWPESQNGTPGITPLRTMAGFFKNYSPNFPEAPG